MNYLNDHLMAGRKMVPGFLMILNLIVWFTSFADAAQQQLSDLAYAGYHNAAGAIVIDTSGAAKLRISFLMPTMVRVQIFPTGVFATNPSPAVARVMLPLTNVTVLNDPDTLILKTAGLSLHLDKAHLRVDAYDADDKNPLTLASLDDGTSWDTTRGDLRQSRLLAADEHIYGLGEDNLNRGMLDRRGTICNMWTGQQISSGNVTANYPVPFYLSTGRDGRGYGVFVDNVWHLRFDIGKTHRNKLTWTAPGGPIDYYLINGPSFKSVINQYTELTGRPTMLPLYAFGYWQSRCFFNNFVDIEHTVNRLKADGLPLDVLVIDSNWSNHEMDYTWKPDFLSGKTAAGWIAWLHAGGIHVMLSTKGPMLRKDIAVFPEALSKGLFATDGRGHTLTTGYYGGELMDFTQPGMEPWLATQLKPLSIAGIDAWWLDLIEPEGEPPQAVYYAGKSADIHNTYPLLNFRTYFEYQRSIDPDGRPVILGRAASAGTQRYSGIVWTGDINSDWPTFQAHLPEAQNTGLSGLPYWANDSGGFISGFLDNDRYGAHAELYERWFEFTCFAPITRAHKAGPSEPYEFGPEVEATAKKYLHLRYRLLPYIYTMAHEAVTTGLPMLRPLILEFQNDPGSATAKTEFMFGRDLLVAPVIWPHTTARRVYFPPGHWISYDEGFETAGTNTLGVSAPCNCIPLFVRAGTILPLAPNMMFTGQKPWDPITLEIWPEGESAGSLYQDDGVTTAFEHGEFTITSFRCREEPGKAVAFEINPSNRKFGPQEWITHFHLSSVPIAVALDGKPVQATTDKFADPSWTFDATHNMLTVRLLGERVAHALTITLDGSAHPRPAAPQVNAPLIGESSTSIRAREIAQFLPPPKLPLYIEAANFDKGGEGLAFHVAKPATNSIYRQDSVPIINSTDAGGGYAISHLQAGDWLAYTLDADDGGWFAISARVLPSTGGQLDIGRRPFKALTDIDVTAPGLNGPKWVSVAGKSLFYLPPGEFILTARVVKPGFQLGNFTFTKPAAVFTAAAENGTITGAGTDKDHPGYKGTGFVAGIGSKTSSVKILVNVPAAGNYLLALRYANGNGDAQVSITLSGGRRINLPLPATGDWAGYAETGVMVELKAGSTEIQVSGTGIGVVNVDEVKLIPQP